MSKRKRESSSPLRSSLNQPCQSTPKSNIFPYSKLPFAQNVFNQNGGMKKSNSTNTFSFHGSGVSEMDLDHPSWKLKAPKYTSPFIGANKPVHTSASISSIESSLSLVQQSNTSSVESLSLSFTNAPNEVSTPNNSFKFVKPLQTAFNSSGILSKKKTKNSQLLQSPMVFQNGVLTEKKMTSILPDTPCKSVSSTSFDSSVAQNAAQSNDIANANDLENLLGYSKKTARQLLSEFKASKDQAISRSTDSWDSDLFLSYKMKFNDKPKKARPTLSINKNINVSVSPSDYLSQSPVSKEMFDDFHSPIMSSFIQRKLKQKDALLPVSMENTNDNNSNDVSSTKRKLSLSMSTNTMHSAKFNSMRTPTTPIFTDPENMPNNPYLTQMFNNKVEVLGKGGFSKVYKVSFNDKFYAIKQLITANKNAVCFSNWSNKNHFIDTSLNDHDISQHLGICKRSKIAFSEEVEILNHLKTCTLKSQDDTKSQHVMNYIDFFQFDTDDYIISEFYGKGSLDQFLLSQGVSKRLDEFRIWKIMFDLLQGLSFLHENNVLHLDLKPANVFIYGEGYLKLGDFGLSTFANSDELDGMTSIDREGDREYIAPEILSQGKYGKPADIFSLGLMIVEIAANIYLPDNGISWQKLRNGDLSDAGRLSTFIEDKGTTKTFINDGKTLDLFVHWMIEPNYADRPAVDELLNLAEMMFVKFSREEASIVYEPKFDGNSTYKTTNNDRQSQKELSRVIDRHGHKSIKDQYSYNEF